MIDDQEATTATEQPSTIGCPACGSQVLYEVTLDYAGDSGFRPDAYGRTPELGDTIASCGDCGTFAVLDHQGAPLGPAPGFEAGDEPGDEPGEEAGEEAGDKPSVTELVRRYIGPRPPTTEGDPTA